MHTLVFAVHTKLPFRMMLPYHALMDLLLAHHPLLEINPSFLHGHFAVHHCLLMLHHCLGAHL
jgi:hypothetical protein